MSAGEREQEYSPSSRISGDYRPFVEAYHRLSREARQGTAIQGGHWEQIRYGSAPGQRIELCLPAAAGRAAPLLVFLHGGYWQELSAEASLFPAVGCAQRGVAFAAIDYTLAPAADLGSIVRECRAALHCLALNADRFGIDACRIVVAGSSAGAHLAASVCLPASRTRPRSGCCPIGAVLVSGIYELEPLIGTSINAALGLDRREARRQSPALAPAALIGFPQTAVCWGEIETNAFKAQSRGFASLLQATGTPCRSLEVAARNHFDVILDLANPHTALGSLTFQLLDSQPH